MEYKELFDRIQYLVNKKKNLKELTEILELKEYEVIGLINLMKENGYLVDYVDGQIIKSNKSYDKKIKKIETKEENHTKFLALSDLHYASKYDYPQLVNYAYELAEKENCDFVTNSGDVFEGDFHNKRTDHIYQVRAHGMEQLDYVVKQYPKSDLPTYYIAGNHDLTFMKVCGADICKMLATERPDLTYLGMDVADINVNGLDIRLRHGTGGQAYSKSYKLQKYCETLPTDDLPSIILQGHYHFSGYFKNRDVYCFNVPSLQGYTPFAKSLGLPQEMGFWILDVYFDKKGNIMHITPELYNFDEKRLTFKKR